MKTSRIYTILIELYYMKGYPLCSKYKIKYKYPEMKISILHIAIGK